MPRTASRSSKGMPRPARGLGVEPGWGLGELAQRAHLTAAEREARGDDRVVEIRRVAETERAERGRISG